METEEQRRTRIKWSEHLTACKRCRTAVADGKTFCDKGFRLSVARRASYPGQFKHFGNLQPKKKIVPPKRKHLPQRRAHNREEE